MEIEASRVEETREGAVAVEPSSLAVIMEDRELKRLLTHLGLPTEYDRTKPARSVEPMGSVQARSPRAARAPPLQDRDCGLESQLDPAADAFDGRDDSFDGVYGERSRTAQGKQPADRFRCQLYFRDNCPDPV